MFGKDSSQLSGYVNTNGAGSQFLRNTIRARVYTGDPIIEEKLTNYQIYWKFYNNRHWAKNNDELLSFNYVRAVIDKVNKFMLGKEGFQVNISDLYGDEVESELEKRYEALINYNWRRNKKLVFLTKLLQMGAVCGDAYVFLSPNKEKGYVEYTLMDSRIVIPMFAGGDYTEPIGYKIIKLLGNNDKEYIQKVTEYTVGNVKTYYLKETDPKADKFEVENIPNDYDFIPIVHLENLPMSDTFGGKSDMEDIVKINKVFNEMAEDIKDTIDYYAQPTTIITGGTIGQVKRGLSEIWSGLPADANVFNLTLGEDLTASMNFLKFLKDAIHDLSGVPDEVLSKVQHISNTSAAALQMLVQPLIQVADNKASSYGAGIMEMNRMTAIIYAKNLEDHPLYKKLPEEARTGDPHKFFDRYVTDIVWQYNLPNDRLSQLNEAVLELTNGLGSREEIMERLGKKNIPNLLAQIDKDAERAVKLEKAKQPEKVPPGTPPPAPAK